MQAIYKFDDRRIVAGRIESGHLAAGDEIVIMPAGKVARIKSVEGWPVTPVKEAQTAGRSVGITLDRELFIERGDVIAHVGSSPRDTRRLRARIFWLHDKPLVQGASILVRLGTRETRATVVAIEKAVDPGELSSVETRSIARNHVGEIDVSLAQALAADPFTDNPRTGRLVLEVNGRDVAITGVYQGRQRMTLTYPILNRAAKILWLVTGANKAEPLARMMAGDRSIPAGRIESKRAVLLADPAAAAKLDRSK